MRRLNKYGPMWESELIAELLMTRERFDECIEYLISVGKVDRNPETKACWSIEHY